MANYNIILTFFGTKGFADTEQDIQNSFSVTLSNYGGSMTSNLTLSNGILTIPLTLPDTKTIAQYHTLVSDIASDIGGEFTLAKQSATSIEEISV